MPKFAVDSIAMFDGCKVVVLSVMDHHGVGAKYSYMVTMDGTNSFTVLESELSPYVKE